LGCAVAIEVGSQFRYLGLQFNGLHLCRVTRRVGRVRYDLEPGNVRLSILLFRLGVS
jgi:hypothetical protein